MTRDNTLLHFQKELVKWQKRRMKEYIRQTKQLEDYYEEYRRELQDFEVLSYPGEVVEKAAQSQVVYVGDFHSLRLAQKLFATLVQMVHSSPARRNRPMVLALEVFSSTAQPMINQYMAGKLSTEEFLQSIDYYKVWPFPFDGYGEVLNTAKRLSIPVFGIDSWPKRAAHRLKARDKHAASIIVRLLEQNPHVLVMVLIGDLHVASCHLPAQTKQIAKKRIGKIEDLIVYVNSETIYWKLAELGLDYLVKAVKVGPGRYCLMNVTPFHKYESFLSLVEGSPEFDIGDSSWFQLSRSVVLEDMVVEYYLRLAKYLGIETREEPDFCLWTPLDLQELDTEQSQRLKKLLQPMAQSRTVAYFPDNRLLFVSRPHVNDAADGAAQLVLARLGWKFDLSPSREGFYSRVISQTLGYFCAKIINPLRACHKEEDLEQMVRAGKKEQNLQPQAKSTVARSHNGIERLVTKYLLPHYHILAKFLNSKENFREPVGLYRLKLSSRLTAARLLGNRLGERLFYSAQIGPPMSLEAKLTKPRYLTFEDTVHILKNPGQALGKGFFHLYLRLWQDTADVIEQQKKRLDWL